jgi:hypothetical protein
MRRLWPTNVVALLLAAGTLESTLAASWAICVTEIVENQVVNRCRSDLYYLYCSSCHSACVSANAIEGPGLSIQIVDIHS